MARDRRKWTKAILETKCLQRTAALVMKQQMSAAVRTVNQRVHYIYYRSVIFRSK
jgi:hypothetical protein